MWAKNIQDMRMRVLLSVMSMYWLSFLMFSAMWPLSSGVQIEVTSAVEVFLPANETTLPCNVTYTEEEEAQAKNMTWSKGDINGPLIIWSEISEGEIRSESFWENVEFGEGCSLIISDPNVTYSGEYTIAVALNSSTESKVVQLIVNDISPTSPPIDNASKMTKSGFLVGFIATLSAVVLHTM